MVPEYKKLIKAKDPRLIDVVLVRHTPMEFLSSRDRDEAFELFLKGANVKQVNEVFKNVEVYDYLTLQWMTVSRMWGYLGDGKELETGSIIKIRDVELTYLDEVKLLSRLRPFNTFEDDDDYAYELVRSDLIQKKQLARDRALWDSADVRMDGVRIKMSDSYPSCS